MVIHPKTNILPKPFPFSSYEWINEPNNVEVYAHQYIKNKTFPPSVYYNEVLDYLRTNGYKEYAWRLSDEIKLEAIRAGKGINPLCAVKISSTKVKEEKEKTIIPRAEETRVRANHMSWFKRLINRFLYWLASRIIRARIDKAIKRHENYVYLGYGEWPLRRFPELIDRLEYLGYKITRFHLGGYEIKWEL